MISTAISGKFSSNGRLWSQVQGSCAISRRAASQGKKLTESLQDRIHLRQGWIRRGTARGGCRGRVSSRGGCRGCSLGQSGRSGADASARLDRCLHKQRDASSAPGPEVMTEERYWTICLNSSQGCKAASGCTNSLTHKGNPSTSDPRPSLALSP